MKKNKKRQTREDKQDALLERLVIAQEVQAIYYKKYDDLIHQLINHYKHLLK